MKPYTLISSDCHAAPPMKDYRAFVEPRFRDDFDRWLAFLQATRLIERSESRVSITELGRGFLSFMVSSGLTHDKLG